MKQKFLFDTTKTNPVFSGRSTKSVTFQGKLDLPIHRWYRLTPSFSPQLAEDIADYFALTKDDFVLDPFSGVGTVPLCMKYRGIPACSVELNPYLFFVSSVKTRTYRDIKAVEVVFKRFLSQFRSKLKKIPYQTNSKTYLEEHITDIPPIKTPERWWSEGNLCQLTCLRKIVANFQTEPNLLDLIKMGILGILVPVSNAKHNHVSLTFAKIPRPTVEVADVLEEQFRKMVSDLNIVSQNCTSDVKIYNGNSKYLTELLPNQPKVSTIITSPPYPNRFSYARETRPHLFFFDFIESAQAVGNLKRTQSAEHGEERLPYYPKKYYHKTK